MHGNGNGMAVSNYTTQVRACERASPSHLPAENDLKGHEMESKPPQLPIKYSLSLALVLPFVRFNHISHSCLGSTTTLWVFEVLNCPISIFLFQYIYKKS